MLFGVLRRFRASYEPTGIGHSRVAEGRVETIDSKSQDQNNRKQAVAEVESARIRRDWEPEQVCGDECRVVGFSLARRKDIQTNLRIETRDWDLHRWATVDDTERIEARRLLAAVGQTDVCLMYRGVIPDESRRGTPY